MKNWIGLGLLSVALVGCIFENESTDVETETETAIGDNIGNNLTPTEQRKERNSQMPLVWNSSKYLGEVKEVKIEVVDCERTDLQSGCYENGESKYEFLERYSSLGALLGIESNKYGDSEMKKIEDVVWDGETPKSYKVFRYDGDESTDWEQTIRYDKYRCEYVWEDTGDGECFFSNGLGEEEILYGMSKHHFTNLNLDSIVFVNDYNTTIELYDDYGVYLGFKYSDGGFGAKRVVEYDTLARTSKVSIYNCSSGECKNPINLDLGSYDNKGNLLYHSGETMFNSNEKLITRYTYTYWE